jgi:hypothetical protein
MMMSSVFMMDAFAVHPASRETAFVFPELLYGCSEKCGIGFWKAESRDQHDALRPLGSHPQTGCVPVSIRVGAALRPSTRGVLVSASQPRTISAPLSDQVRTGLERKTATLRPCSRYPRTRCQPTSNHGRAALGPEIPPPALFHVSDREMQQELAQSVTRVDKRKSESLSKPYVEASL